MKSQWKPREKAVKNHQSANEAFSHLGPFPLTAALNSSFGLTGLYNMDNV